METSIAMDKGMFLQNQKTKMSHSAVMHHRFLVEFEHRQLTMEQLRRFAIQWYKTARAHKQAFPALIYNTKDDDIRFDLIDILNEEYGNGDRERIHARLLRRLLLALGILDCDVENSETLNAVKNFSEEVERIWKEEDPVYAFGLHFALEFLASSLHTHFARGLDKYTFLTLHDRSYFDYHKTAEKEHADFSERGFLVYAADQEAHNRLSNGVDKAIRLMDSLWEDFYQSIFVNRAHARV